jgi:pyrroloquinoline quinone biosynthesis protein D
VIAEAAIPRLNRGVKLREDTVRARWIVLAPERMFVPDEVALEVLRLVDGARSVGAIADDLAARFAAPREEILADVTDMLADLAEKGVVAT